MAPKPIVQAQAIRRIGDPDPQVHGGQMSSDADRTEYYVKATDPTSGEHVAFVCRDLAIANAKAAE
jgi:hypothetical protein